MKKIIKGILLWNTIFIITIFIMRINLIMNVAGPLHLLIGTLICIILVLVCYIAINKEELKEILLYKWIKRII